MKDQVRLDRLRDMYKSKGYDTDNMSESDLGWIAYSRGVNLNYYREIGVLK